MNEPEALRSRYAALLERVRQASRDGSLVRLDEALVRLDEKGEPSGAGVEVRLGETAAPGTSGAGVSPADLIALAEAGRLDDLAVVREGGHAYLYSTNHMTRQYAETAARAAEGDVPRLIAEAVRADSATYPRPTTLDVFAERPFKLTADQISLALEHMLAGRGFDDIRKVTASDGTVFLFSARHLEPGHASSLAEWLAVGRANNP